jgi:hypothetical protein
MTTLAATGQTDAVSTGKIMTAWSALALVASVARVPVFRAVRYLMIPVLTDLMVSTLSDFSLVI